METVTYNGVEYAHIDLPKVGEKVLVQETDGNYLEVLIDIPLALTADGATFGVGKVLRRVNPQPEPQRQPQPQAPAPLTAEQQVWLTVYAAGVSGGYYKDACVELANEAHLLFNQRFNPSQT